MKNSKCIWKCGHLKIQNTHSAWIKLGNHEHCNICLAIWTRENLKWRYPMNDTRKLRIFQKIFGNVKMWKSNMHTADEWYFGRVHMRVSFSSERLMRVGTQPWTYMQSWGSIWRRELPCLPCSSQQGKGWMYTHDHARTFSPKGCCSMDPWNNSSHVVHAKNKEGTHARTHMIAYAQSVPLDRLRKELPCRPCSSRCLQLCLSPLQQVRQASTSREFLGYCFVSLWHQD